MTKIKKFFITSIILLFFFGLSYSAIAADLSNAFGDGSNLDYAADQSGYDIYKDSPENIIASIINIALSLLGVIFLALMVYGGYLWMTARGNEENVTKAQNIITAAVIGLVIVISAYAISVFVITKLGEKTLMQGP